MPYPSFCAYDDQGSFLRKAPSSFASMDPSPDLRILLPPRFPSYFPLLLLGVPITLRPLTLPAIAAWPSVIFPPPPHSDFPSLCLGILPSPYPLFFLFLRIDKKPHLHLIRLLGRAARYSFTRATYPSSLIASSPPLKASSPPFLDHFPRFT